MVRWCFITICLCVSACGLSGQETATPPHVHHVVPSKIIDGAVHPELISDSTAHRLFFLTVSVYPDASDNEKMRQNAHLKQVGLSEDDRKSFILVLANFKVQYKAFMERWNEAATAAIAKNERFNTAVFLKQRDDLVQQTRNTLASALTPDGLNRLRMHVNAEKSKMKVNAGEAQ